MSHPERFFTFWAFVAHLLYAVGLFPCTLLIAVITSVGSIIHNVYINKNYNAVIDILLHHVPLALIAGAIYYKVLPINQGPVTIAIFTLAFAAAYVIFNGGFSNVREYYADIHKAFVQ